MQNFHLKSNTKTSFLNINAKTLRFPDILISNLESMSYAFGSGNLNSTLTLLLNFTFTFAPVIKLITTPLKIIISLPVRASFALDIQ